MSKPSTKATRDEWEAQAIPAGATNQPIYQFLGRNILRLAGVLFLVFLVSKVYIVENEYPRRQEVERASTELDHKSNAYKGKNSVNRAAYVDDISNANVKSTKEEFILQIRGAFQQHEGAYKRKYLALMPERLTGRPESELIELSELMSAWELECRPDTERIQSQYLERLATLKSKHLEEPAVTDEIQREIQLAREDPPRVIHFWSPAGGEDDPDFRLMRLREELKELKMMIETIRRGNEELQEERDIETRLRWRKR